MHVQYVIFFTAIKNILITFCSSMLIDVIIRRSTATITYSEVCALEIRLIIIIVIIIKSIYIAQSR